MNPERVTITPCIERWNEMMVSINLVHWRRMAPANGFVPEPVENVLTHDATEARMEENYGQNEYDKSQSRRHRGHSFHETLCAPATLIKDPCGNRDGPGCSSPTSGSFRTSSSQGRIFRSRSQLVARIKMDEAAKYVLGIQSG